MSEDCIAKLTLNEQEERELESEESQPASLNQEVEVADEEYEEEEEEEEEEGGDGEDDFSFVCVNTDGSPISAEEIFQNGQIRPIFPIFNRALLFGEDGGVSSSPASGPTLRPPLKKLFVEDRPSSSSSEDDDELEAIAPGTYCEWSVEKSSDALPEMRKKSNSTGFSRLWRFRELGTRSSSDGKDAFVFLNPNSVAAASKQPEASKTTTTPAAIPAKADKVSAAIAAAATAAKAPTKKKREKTAASSAHEKHYVRNRAKKEVDKRRSYLPYRPELVGFFTSVNGLSRNVHPF